MSGPTIVILGLATALGSGQPVSQNEPPHARQLWGIVRSAVGQPATDALVAAVLFVERTTATMPLP